MQIRQPNVCIPGVPVKAGCRRLNWEISFSLRKIVPLILDKNTLNKTSTP